MPVDPWVGAIERSLVAWLSKVLVRLEVPEKDARTPVVKELELSDKPVPLVKLFAETAKAVPLTVSETIFAVPDVWL